LAITGTGLSPVSMIRFIWTRVCECRRRPWHSDWQLYKASERNRHVRPEPGGAETPFSGKGL